jgi:hypothetical protein
MNFPKKLYVKIEGEKNDQYFVASEDTEFLSEVGEKVKVATYQLVTVEIAEVTTKLVPLPKKRAR